MKATEQDVVIFQALGHLERLHILEILSRGPSCVCDLVKVTGKRQPYISQQLMTLSQAHLVAAERSGRKILYHLNADKVDDAKTVLQLLCQPTSLSLERRNSYVRK
jgi:ArsR family transcriptional regulator, arsenate/arsenite/antimonite-responsive transcriptional repressor